MLRYPSSRSTYEHKPTASPTPCASGSERANCAILNVEGLWQTPQHSGKQVPWVKAQSPRHGDEFNHVDAAIAIFELADELLRFAETAGQLHLGHARSFASG